MPGSSPQLFEKAAKSAADVVFLDLEDAVAPDHKEAARRTSSRRSTISTGAPRPCRCASTARHHYMYRDVVDVLEHGATAST